MKKALKQQSLISPMFELLEFSVPLFLDRDQGNKQMPEILRKANITFHCHSDFYNDTTEDDVWIRDVAQKGWLIVTSDKGLETDPINRSAVVESKAKVYVLDEHNARAVFWAAAVVVSKDRIYELARDHNGPFYVNVHRTTPTLLWKFRVPTVSATVRIATPRVRSRKVAKSPRTPPATDK